MSFTSITGPRRPEPEPYRMPPYHLPPPQIAHPPAKFMSLDMGQHPGLDLSSYENLFHRGAHHGLSEQMAITGVFILQIIKLFKYQ